MGNFVSFVLYKNSKGKLYKYFNRNEYFWLYSNGKKSECNATILSIDDNEFKIIDKNMKNTTNTVSGYYSTPTLVLCSCNNCGIKALEENFHTVICSTDKEISELSIPKRGYYKTYITDTLYRKTVNDFLYIIPHSIHIFNDDYPNKSLYKLSIELEGAKFDVIVFIYFRALCNIY